MNESEFEEKGRARASAVDTVVIPEVDRYLIVVHGWHVSSKGFDVHEFEGSREEAYEKGYALKGRRDRTFDRCAFTVIPIGKMKRIKMERRKLTWKERLLGKLMV